jgi:hypothetical protein
MSTLLVTKRSSWAVVEPGGVKIMGETEVGILLRKKGLW